MEEFIICLDLNVECAWIKSLFRNGYRSGALCQAGFADLFPVTIVEKQTPSQRIAALHIVQEGNRELSRLVGSEGIVVGILVIVENTLAGGGKRKGTGCVETVIGFQFIGAVCFPLAFRGEICGDGVSAGGRIVGVMGREGEIVHAGCPAVCRERGVAVDVVILADLCAVCIIKCDAIAVPEV